MAVDEADFRDGFSDLVGLEVVMPEAKHMSLELLDAASGGLLCGEDAPELRGFESFEDFVCWDEFVVLTYLRMGVSCEYGWY